jgi:hypothetical protein
MGLSIDRDDHELWPQRTWREDADGRLVPRASILVAGAGGQPIDVLRRCVLLDEVLIAGPLVGFEDVQEEVDARAPDVVLLCGTTDDLRLHAAMHALHHRAGTTRVALMVRLGDATRCLPMGDVGPGTEELLRRVADEVTRERRQLH